MSTNLETIPIVTSKGVAEGISLKWESFSLLLIGAPKGFLACCIFDIDVINEFDVAAALVKSGPGSPIGTIENMETLTLMRVNEKAAALGLEIGMPAKEAIELLF